MQRTVLFVACILVCATMIAQQYPFVHYTPREGLVNNRARFIFQDSKGKLYISTYGGLSIYDGVRFINYTINNALGSDMINDIVEMGEDSIWIVPNARKIHCLVKGKLKDFTPANNYIPLINQLLKSGSGYYYAMADEGLFRLENNRFIKLPLNGMLNERTAKTLLRAVEINKKLYILSNPDYKLSRTNLLVYDLVKNKVVAFSNIHASYLFSPSENELWISTPNGLYMLDQTGMQKDQVILKPLPDSCHIPKKIEFDFIYKDRQNNTWLAARKGLYRISKDRRVTLFTIENGLTSNAQSFIFQDYENNMWFTNEQTGLCKLSNQQLAYYPYYPPSKSGYLASDIFAEPSNDSVWLFDSHFHRILILLPDGRTTQYTFKKTFPWYSKFVPANNGEYMLNYNRIFRLKVNPANKQYTLSLCYTDPDTTAGFTAGTRDRNGNLVAISNKLVVVAGNKVMKESFYYMADQVSVDKNNRIWIAARSNKLFCFQVSGSGNNAKLSLLRIYPDILPGSSPRSIAADQSGNIWIGSRDWGLYCFHFDGLSLKRVRRLTTQNGLSENFVNYLFCDKDNNIWACTPSGLDKIKIHNDQFLIENITRSNNLYQPVLKIQQTGKGLFWILTSAGMITYNPVRLPMNDWKPSLSFSEVVNSNAGNMPVPPDRELSHLQNNLAFQLSAPSYIDEKQTRFSYLLEGGGNTNWSEPSVNASINLVNLPPGKYTLRAKAIFLHGLYSDAESSYSFTVLPPWWQTWWFKSLVGLLILALALWTLKSYINRKLRIQRVMLEKRRAIEQERTRIATDMHDDLGAGLSRIKFLSETIGMKKQQHLPIEEEISSIRTYSHEMIDKMGEIVWALNEKNDTLSDLLSYTRAYAVEYLEQNGISCRVEEPDNLPQDIVNGEFRRNIYLTVKETLHNIVKHAQATEVCMKIDVTHRLSIQISDNGIGIDLNSGKLSGNGLFNMNTRIQGLNGRFEIVNSNGTQVNMVVPLNL